MENQYVCTDSVHQDNDNHKTMLKNSVSATKAAKVKK